jgi:hypothetical protein
MLIFMRFQALHQGQVSVIFIKIIFQKCYLKNEKTLRNNTLRGETVPWSRWMGHGTLLLKCETQVLSQAIYMASVADEEHGISFSQSTEVFPCQYHSNSCSKFIHSFIYHQCSMILTTDGIIESHT